MTTEKAISVVLNSKKTKIGASDSSGHVAIEYNMQTNKAIAHVVSRNPM